MKTNEQANGEVRRVEELLERFQAAGTRRACIVLREGEYQVHVDRTREGADPILPLVQEYLPRPEDWRHQAVFIGRPSEKFPEIDTLFFAFVHDTRRGLAQGGLRLRDYTQEGGLAKLFEDGLRLSEGMTMKNAMASLWWGGGKGVIAEVAGLAEHIWPVRGGEPDRHVVVKGKEIADYPPGREKLFEEYGRFVASLGGIYYTAADMNTYGVDMLRVLRTNRFVTCLPPDAGGSADPSPHTAEGVCRAIDVAWRILDDTDSIRGVRVAVQGAGKVGRSLVGKLLREGAEVWVGDKDASQIAELIAELEKSGTPGRENLHVVELRSDRDVIMRQEVDVISPCAAGQAVNADTIANFAPSVRLVCGAANNMLGEEDRDAGLLHERGICYVPDFVCNRMGIMNCADEWMGYLEEDSREEVRNVAKHVKEIVEAWKGNGTPTLRKAREIAERRLQESHPYDRLQGRGERLLKEYLRKLRPGR